MQPLNGDSGAGTNVDLRVDFIICVEQEYHPHTTKSIIRYTTSAIYQEYHLDSNSHLNPFSRPNGRLLPLACHKYLESLCISGQF